MKTSFLAFFVTAYFGFFTTSAYSMEKTLVKNTASPLEGVMSLNIASGLTTPQTDIQKLDQINSINLLPETTNSLFKTDVNSKSSLSLTIKNVEEPPINSFQVPLIQF